MLKLITPLESVWQDWAKLQNSDVGVTEVQSPKLHLVSFKSVITFPKD
jgi:hypothetical protein